MLYVVLWSYMGAILVLLDYDYDFYIVFNWYMDSAKTQILRKYKVNQQTILLIPCWMGTCTRSEPKCPTHGMVFWNYVQTLCSYVQKLRHASYALLGGLA